MEQIFTAPSHTAKESKTMLWLQNWILSLVCIAVLGATIPTVALGETRFAFPADSGVVDVKSTPYNAKGDGVTDDTNAIQQALNDHPAANRIIFLPLGTYLISDTLRWPEGNRRGQEQKRVILQGQSRDGVVLKLQDGAAGYEDPVKSKAVVWTGKKPAQRFRNSIRDLTIDTGRTNPGAIGLQFIANNQGAIRNLRIRSGDGRGGVGLDMGYTDEIGPLLVKGLTVEGFDVGIRTSWQTASITFENVVLRNQNRLGWENFGQTIFVHGLEASGGRTILKNVKNAPSRIVLIDADLSGHGEAAGEPAILNMGRMFARDIRTDGFASAIAHDDKRRGNTEGVPEDNTGEWLSHEKPVSLFPSAEMSLRLPIRPTPDVLWDDLSQWASPLDYGAKPDDGVDDTDAVQRAIDSGASTVYLPNGTWNLDGELLIRGKVHRLIGTEATIDGEGPLRFVEGDSTHVVIERLELRGGTRVIHDSARTLVLVDILSADYAGTKPGGRYRNTEKGTGDLFLEDVAMAPILTRGQRVWARQLNQETDTQQSDDVAKIVNDGGQLWILGLKTEMPGTIISTINGGRTEVLGAFILNNGEHPADPAFICDESTMSLAGVWETRFGNPPISQWVKETRDGETRLSEGFGRSSLFVANRNLAR